MKQFNNVRGVTLIELIMVMVIVGILGGGLSLGIREAVELYRFLSFRNEIVAQGRLALMRMGREIRQMAPRDPTFKPIAAAEDHRLRFTAIDLDEYGVEDIVEFYQTGNELRRIFNDTPAEGNILASNVNNLVFTYYDKNNNQLSTPVADTSKVYRIVIALTLKRGTQTLTLRSQICPRNL